MARTLFLGLVLASCFLSGCCWEDVRDSLYEATIHNPRERPPDYGQWIPGP
jgi:hypothetical protein